MIKKICSVMLLCATILMASCQKDDEATIGVSEVKLDKTELSLVVDAGGTLLATILPDNAEDATVTWSSSDKTVATVSEAGVVSAIKVGETTITATAGGKTATCKVTVTAKEIAVTGVTLNKTTTTIEKEKTEKLVPTIAPTNATDQTVTWSSDKETVATVAQDGTVTAVAAGEANITVTTKDGAKTATCKVTVPIEWTKGNLVADGKHGAKIGTATDGGLFFQFGSLVGWSETGSSPTVAISPVDYTGSNTWNKDWTGDPATENVATGTGDPCRYYLKGTWRLPTKDEYVALFKDGGYPSGTWKWENASATNTASGLTFPASGYRNYAGGSLLLVGTAGYYWSASPFNASSGYNLSFHSSNVNPSNLNIRANGLPVRCVQ